MFLIIAILINLISTTTAQNTTNMGVMSTTPIIMTTFDTKDALPQGGDDGDGPILQCWSPFDPFGATDCMVLFIVILVLLIIFIILFSWFCIIKPKREKRAEEERLSQQRGIKQQQISGALDNDNAFNNHLNNVHSNGSSQQHLNKLSVSTPETMSGKDRQRNINRVSSLEVDHGGISPPDDEMEMVYKKYTMTVDDDYDARSYHESDDEVLNNDDEKEMEYVTPGGDTPQ